MARLSRVAAGPCLALCLVVQAASVSAEVTNVTIVSRGVIADGQAFGATGPYERLTGRIEFALDPADPHNRVIADLQHARRDADGRVRFSSDLHVLRPVDPSKGNGVLLFDIANRGRRVLLGRFNRARPSPDPTADADFGDGFLMKDGYTLVTIGWEADVPAPSLRLDAPRAELPAGEDDRLSVELQYNDRVSEALLIDDPAGRPPVIYPPVDPASAADVLTVRDRYWDEGQVIPRDRWRFVGSVAGGSSPGGPPKLQLDGGFEPGRFYRITYRATGALVTGAGLAAIRDAAAAFRYRTDLPIQGRAAYAFGISQTGRLLRQFLYDGFNADERDRRVFDALWIHIAGAARGSFNERLARSTHGDAFRPTKFPFTDDEQADVDGTRGGIQSRYRADLRPKVFYTNTSVEYWGGGRAAALTHTSLDGKRDLTLPDNVRSYLLAGTQHGEAAFPPPPRGQAPAGGAATTMATRNNGQQLSNPAPQSHVMRALMRAWHDWAANGTPPPASSYPRLADKTLVAARDIKFPAIPGVADPRGIEPPGRIVNGKVTPLPHLVPQVDADGNEMAGIRTPEVAAPLATTTGWNFRDASVGNPGVIYQLLGSYIPFAPTKAARQANGDPRPSVEERYRDLDDYLRQIRAHAQKLIEARYLLQEDLDDILSRAKTHWNYATTTAATTTRTR
jgi:hypothetical protein